jgi:hypothetical protein
LLVQQLERAEGRRAGHNTRRAARILIDRRAAPPVHRHYSPRQGTLTLSNRQRSRSDLVLENLALSAATCWRFPERV